MKELKSKKTGLVTVCSEEEYANLVNRKPEWLKRFDVTDLKGIKQALPSVSPTEIKVTKAKKNEG
jgi:hypothetical protein